MTELEKAHRIAQLKSVSYAGKNKGTHLLRVQTKIEKFKAGLPIECKKHGEHLLWRECKTGNVQCKLCSRENAKRYRYENYFKYMAAYAAKRGYVCDVTEDFLKELLAKQNNRCAITGLLFTDNYKPSLDRIDSDKGYTRNNVQLVLFDVNRMKTDFKFDYFIDLCRKVVAHIEPEYGISGCI